MRLSSCVFGFAFHKCGRFRTFDDIFCGLDASADFARLKLTSGIAGFISLTSMKSESEEEELLAASDIRRRENDIGTS